MVNLPKVITLRLDDTTVASIRDRIGEGFRVKSLSEFIREGIRLRLAEPDDYTGWLVSRRASRAAASETGR